MVTPQIALPTIDPDAMMRQSEEDLANTQLTIAKRWELEKAYSERLRAIHTDDAEKLKEIDEDQLKAQGRLLDEALKKQTETGKTMREVLGGTIVLNVETGEAINSNKALTTKRLLIILISLNLITLGQPRKS